MGLGAAATASLATGLLFEHGDSLGLKLSVTANSYDWSPYYPLDLKPDITPDDPNHSLGRGRQVFVIGDSHAGAYTAMAKLAAARLGAKARILSLDGCPIATLISSAENVQLCGHFERNILTWMTEHAKPGDVVFLASLRMHRLGNQWGLYDQAEARSRSAVLADAEERERALAQATSLIGKLEALGFHVLMDAPLPIFKAPPFRCSDWFNRSNPVCEPGFTMDREVLLTLREPTMAALRVLQTSLGVYVWDPFPILCGGPVCSAFDGSKPIFSDGDHLSGHGDRLLVPSFTNQLKDIWKDDASAPKLSNLEK